MATTYPATVAPFPNDNGSDWVNPAFQEICRVLRWNRFCVSFYGTKLTNSSLLGAMGIPAKLNAHSGGTPERNSGMIPDTMERSDAIVLESVWLRQEKLGRGAPRSETHPPNASEGASPATLAETAA